MKCQMCGNEFYEGIFCPECGTKFEEENIKSEELLIENEKMKSEQLTEVEKIKVAYEVELENAKSEVVLKQAMISNEKKLNEGNRKKGNTLSILSIVFGGIGLICTCFFIGIIPAIAGLVLGIIAVVKKQKIAIIGIVCSLIGLIIGVALWGWMISDIKNEMKVENMIENGEYDAAIEMLEDYPFSDSKKNTYYYDIYIGQGRYDEAFDVLFNDIETNYTSIDKVSEEDMEKLSSIYEMVSEENKIKIECFKEDRDALIAKKEAEEKAKKEAEEKAKKEAEEKAKKEAEEKAKKEAEEKENKEVDKSELEENENLKSNIYEGHVASDEFTNQRDLVSPERVFIDFSHFENIYLVKHNVVNFSDDDKKNFGEYEQLDNVEAKMSHYDESGLVGIEYEVKLNYFGKEGIWDFETSVITAANLDMTELEGKSFAIDKNCYGSICELFGIESTPNATCILSFHNVDRVMTKIPKDSPFGDYYVYSKEPVVRVSALIDGKSYEGEFCLGAQKENAPYETTDYSYSNYSENWYFSVLLETDKSDELVMFSIDLDSAQ